MILSDLWTRGPAADQDKTGPGKRLKTTSGKSYTDGSLPILEGNCPLFCLVPSPGLLKRIRIPEQCFFTNEGQPGLVSNLRLSHFTFFDTYSGRVNVTVMK